MIDTTPAPDDQIRMVRTFGQTLRVSVKPGTGVPLVLCNGIGARLEVLEPLVDNLAGRTVIRFDVPGTGGSPNSLLPYGFPYLAVVLGRMLDELGYDRVDMLGSRGAARWPSSSRSRTRADAVGSSSWPPPPVR